MILPAALLAISGAVAAQELRTDGPSGSLAGTWTKAADANAPIVLVIPGSGPTDRDGNSPLGIRAQSYRLMADGLAEAGISSVRIDKRGMFGSAGAALDANAVTIDDYVDDVLSWVETLRVATGRTCVWLLGHSEGGLVALAAAQRAPDICGLILVATAGRPLGVVLKEQLRANPANAPFIAQAEAVIDTLASGERVDRDNLPAPLLPLFAPQLQGFLISAFALDPAVLVGTLDRPILVVQGDSDLQVGLADARALTAAAPAAQLLVLPGTNHVLKSVPPGDRAANIATYADPDLPLAPHVVKSIRHFISSSGVAD